MEDLVRPRAADPRDGALVAEQRVEPPRVRSQDLPERLGAEPERLGTEVRQLLLGSLGGQQPDARTLLRPGFRQHELGAALETQAEGGRLRALLAGGQVSKPPGGHQVHEQDKLAVLGGKQEALAAPVGPCEAPPIERRERRLETPQPRDVPPPPPLA